MPVWKSLPVSQRNYRGPPLYIKHDIHNQGYDIGVTDLTRIWNETLVWKKIVLRSLQEDIAIDLTQSDQQGIFLGYLRGAIEGASQTSLAIFPGQVESQLIFRLNVKLPGNFKPLVWNAYLQLQPQEQTAEQLTLPALHSLQEAREEVADLIKCLHEKDRVIGKLMDKFKSTGLGLDDVFPNAGPTVRGQRPAKNHSIFYKYVPGLKEFDNHEFQESRKVIHASDDSPAPSRILKDGLDCIHHTSWKPPGMWWQNLASESESQDPSFVPDSQPKPASLPVRESTNGFETQQSHAMQAGSSPSPPLDEEMTGAAEGLDDISPPQQRNHRKAPSHKGDADGADARVRRRPAPSAGPSKPNEQCDSDDESTTVGGSDDEQRKLLKEPSREPPPGDAQISPGKRLGTLGGKKRQTPEPGPSSFHETGMRESPKGESSSSALPTSNVRGKLGRIGGSRAPPEPAPSYVHGHALSSPSSKGAGEGLKTDGARHLDGDEPNASAERPKRETSEERTIRNRSEIKRELDEKRKAPAKKKRKF